MIDTTLASSALDYALMYADMDILVFPIVPGTKIPATLHGVKDATKDKEQITKWWSENPNYGIGLAAEFKLGGACFLEFDQPPSLPAWAKEEKQPKPVTRLHKSGGKVAPHYIFRHTEKSLELGNANGSFAGHEWFSFRADRRYVVAPPSIHPDSGKPYTVEIDMEPIPIPDWVVAKIAKNGVSERQFGESLRPCSEDFDFSEFMDWLADAGCELGVTDGDWIPFLKCPCAGRRHAGQGVRGCALYWDGNGLGFKCQAQNCPSNTDRKANQSGIGYLVSFLSQEFEPYDGVIWDEREDQLGAVEADKYETAPIKVEIPPIPKETEDQKAVREAEAIVAKWDASGVTAAATAPAKEKKQAVPELWEMPESAMYGWLGDIARSLGAPLSLAYPTMLCVFAGQGVTKANSVLGNLYGCMIGAKGTGKTRTAKRALAKLEYEFPWMVKKNYPGSEHGLMLALGGKKAKDMEVMDYTITKPFLLVQDELRSTFGKMGIDNSALPFAFNHLFNDTVYETANQKGHMVVVAQLSILGGLTAENAEQFADVFGRSTTTGTYDRFIFGVAPPTWEWDDSWEDTMEPVERKPRNVHFPQEAFDMKRDWQKVNPQVRMRLGELALRVANVTASANGDPNVNQECMQAALAFCEWQERIRAHYQPSDQDDKDGKCQEAIVRVLQTMGQESGDGWVNWRTARVKGNLYRHTATRLQRIYKGMVEMGMIEEEKDCTDDDGNPTKGKKVKTGRVRLSKDVE